MQSASSPKKVKKLKKHACQIITEPSNLAPSQIQAQLAPLRYY